MGQSKETDRAWSLLPLFPTKEGGEGWGEEDFELEVPLSPTISPLREASNPRIGSLKP